MDWVHVCVALAVFHILLSLWLFRQVIFTLQALVGELDGNIGLAIQKIIEGGFGEMEQINPIQQAIAQMLMKKVENPTIEAVIADRGKDGKFSS